MHASVCDQLADLVQNSIEAGAHRIELVLEQRGKWLDVCVTDDGSGMSEEVREQALSPFFTDGRKHASRRVGLGLPFLQQLVDATGGEMGLETAQGQGTTVWFRLPTGHVDCPPLGDLPASLLGLMTFAGTYDLIVGRSCNGQRYDVSRLELVEALGELETAGSLDLARRYLASLEEAVT